MPPRWPITAPATVTLAGLRIDRAEQTPAELHNQLIGWHQIASIRDTLVLPLDARGRPLRHDGRSVRLKLPSSKARHLATRALRRAIARAFNDTSITIRGDWSRKRCAARSDAVIATICILGMIVFFITAAAVVARDLLGAPLPMLALGAVGGLMISVGIVAMAMSIVPIWRQASVLRLRADFRGLHLIRTGDRRHRVAWSQVRAISPSSIMLVLDSGKRIWLPGHQQSLSELLVYIRKQRRLKQGIGRAAIFWIFLILVLPVLMAAAIWWNASLGLLPPTPPQTILFIALAPAIVGLLPLAVLLLIDRRNTAPTP